MGVKVETKTFTYEEAEKFCLAFAEKHGVDLIRYGTCGFGRHCSGLSKNGTWLAYNPHTAEYKSYGDLNPSSFPRVEKFAKVDLFAPEGVNSYHKDDFICVLHGGGFIDPEIFGKFMGALAGENYEPDEDENTPDDEKPVTEDMALAVIQLAQWLLDLERRAKEAGSELFVDMYPTGYRGLNAAINGTQAPAIGVR